jgi:hypothetical protein
METKAGVFDDLDIPFDEPSIAQITEVDVRPAMLPAPIHELIIEHVYNGNSYETAAYWLFEKYRIKDYSLEKVNWLLEAWLLPQLRKAVPTLSRFVDENMRDVLRKVYGDRPTPGPMMREALAKIENGEDRSKVSRRLFEDARAMGKSYRDIRKLLDKWVLLVNLAQAVELEPRPKVYSFQGAKKTLFAVFKDTYDPSLRRQR